MKTVLLSQSPDLLESLRRMVAGWQAVEAQERQERRQTGPDSAGSVRGALELVLGLDPMLVRERSGG